MTYNVFGGTLNLAVSIYLYGHTSLFGQIGMEYFVNPY